MIRKECIKPQIGYQQLFAKAKGTPELKTHPEINIKESCHMFPTCMDSGVNILSLPQLCDCDCKSEVQEPFLHSTMMGNTTKHCFQNDARKSEPPSDRISYDYFKNNALSVALTTDSKSVISSSITIMTSGNKTKDLEKVHLSVTNTVSLSSWIINGCQEMSEATEKIMVREGDITVPPWGAEIALGSLLPVSDCIYDNQGRLIRMTVHLLSAESDISSSCSDDVTEDVFELNWQSGEEDNDESLDRNICYGDDCLSDDSDICIAFEEPCLGQNSCELMSVYLETPICDINNGSQGVDVIFNDFDDKRDCNTSSRKRVSFRSDLTEVHQIIAWKYAYHAARKGPRERAAADRAHFKQRIMEVETILAPTLQKQLNNLLPQRPVF